MDLGRDHQFVAAAEVLQGPADDLLAATGGVDVCCVEEVDPRLDCLTDQRSAALLVQGPRVGATLRDRRSSYSRARAERPPARCCLNGRIPSFLISLAEAAVRQPSRAHQWSFPWPFSRFRWANLCIGRRRVWPFSGIGEPATEVEDACADEVPVAFGRQVLRLAWAELSRTWDECRAESRPLGKCEIAVVGRREHDLAWSQPQHPRHVPIRLRVGL